MWDRVYWAVGFIVCLLFVLANLADGVIDFSGRVSRTVEAADEPGSFWIHIGIAFSLGGYCLKKLLK